MAKPSGQLLLVVVVAGVALAVVLLALAVKGLPSRWLLFRINNFTAGLNPSSFGVKHLFCG